jgi:predicted DNA-binding transcriptional regulator AlpA
MSKTSDDRPKGVDPPREAPLFPMTGFVRVKQILAPLGPLPISRSGFWAGVKAGRYPKPRKLSARVTVWLAEDIHALVSKISNDEV